MNDPSKSKDRCWVCPNDRQLALRAKLKTGWSVKTGSLNSYSKPQALTEEEQQRILEVIKKSESMEQGEQIRVGRLVEKLQKMKTNALGDGTTHCILCGETFGLLGPTSYVCRDCRKNFCAQCGVETVNSQREQILLCKLCAEAREIWKKSGAWFFKSMPKFVIPGDRRPSDRPARYMTGSNWNLPTTKKPTWARPRGLSTSEIETGESSEDDPAFGNGARSAHRTASTANLAVSPGGRRVPNGSANKGPGGGGASPDYDGEAASSALANEDQHQLMRTATSPATTTTTPSKGSFRADDVGSSGRDTLNDDNLSRQGSYEEYAGQEHTLTLQAEIPFEDRPPSRTTYASFLHPSTPGKDSGFQLMANSNASSASGAAGAGSPSWAGAAKGQQQRNPASSSAVEDASANNSSDGDYSSLRGGHPSASAPFGRGYHDGDDEHVRMRRRPASERDQATSTTSTPALRGGGGGNNSGPVDASLSVPGSADDVVRLRDKKGSRTTNYGSPNRRGEVLFVTSGRDLAPSSPSSSSLSAGAAGYSRLDSVQSTTSTALSHSWTLRHSDQNQLPVSGFYGAAAVSPAGSRVNLAAVGLLDQDQDQDEVLTVRESGIATLLGATPVGRSPNLYGSLPRSPGGRPSAIYLAETSPRLHRRQSSVDSTGTNLGPSASQGSGSTSGSPPVAVRNHRRRGSSGSDSIPESGAGRAMGGGGFVGGSSRARRGSTSSLETTESVGGGLALASRNNVRHPSSSTYASQPYLNSAGTGGGRIPSAHDQQGAGGRSRPGTILPGALGILEFSLRYDVQNHVLHLTIIRARNLQPMDQTGYSDPYVNVQLLPAGAPKSSEFRTKTVHRTLNPDFNETISYNGVMETDMARKYVRLTIMDEDRYGHDCLGEIKVPLVRLKPNFTQMFNMFLEPPTSVSDPRTPGDVSAPSPSASMTRRPSMPVHSSASFSSLLPTAAASCSSSTTAVFSPSPSSSPHHQVQVVNHVQHQHGRHPNNNGHGHGHGHHHHQARNNNNHHHLHNHLNQTQFNGDHGRILLSLKYSTHRQGLLVGIVRCVGLDAKDPDGFSDPFVKVQLRPDPSHRKFKTSIKWKTLNPEFNEEFVFESKLKELPRKTLEISVWDKDMGRRDDYLGGLHIGIDSKGERLRHWFETIKNPDIRHDRWHFLSQEFMP